MGPKKKPKREAKRPIAATGAPSRSSRGVNAAALARVAAAVAAAGPPLKKVYSDEVQELAVTSECIRGFIDYVRTKGHEKNVDKWKRTDENTVIENLIEVMNAKGYVKLTPAKIDQMMIDIDKPEIRRDPIFEIIAGFTNQTFAFTAGEQRRLSTISNSSLTAATQESDPSFVCTEYWTCTNPEIALSPEEIEIANAIIGPETPFLDGNKKECSRCWICDKPVYVYELNHSSTETTYKKCGEDEHVSPPGIGNIFGLLYPDKVRTSQMIHFGYVKQGLKSSHTWCNRVKSEFNLISPPTTLNPIYTLRIATLTELLTKANSWLTKWDTNRVDIDIIFHTAYDPRDRSEFIDNIRTTITTYITALCIEMNKTVSVVSDTPMIMYKLRLIFNSCLIGRDILFKTIKGFQTTWERMNAQTKKGAKKGGGYKQTGGEFTTYENQQLDNLFLQITGFNNNNDIFINKKICETGDDLKYIEETYDKYNYKKTISDDNYKLSQGFNLFNIRDISDFNTKLQGRIDYLHRLRRLDPSIATGIGRARNLAAAEASRIPSVELPPVELPPVDVYYELRDGDYVYQYTEASVEEPYEYKNDDGSASASEGAASASEGAASEGSMFKFRDIPNLDLLPVNDSFADHHFIYDSNWYSSAAARSPIEEAKYQLKIADDELAKARQKGNKELIETKLQVFEEARAALRNLEVKVKYSRKAPAASAAAESYSSSDLSDDDFSRPSSLRLEEAEKRIEELKANLTYLNKELEKEKKKLKEGTDDKYRDETKDLITAIEQELRKQQQELRDAQQELIDAQQELHWMGGKKTKKQRKSKKGRKTRKFRKSKKVKGGNRIGGSNIGSNCNDPNFSIYNTNMLKLFPYKGGSAIPPKSNQNLLRTQEGLELEQLTEEERQQRLEEEEERQRLEDIRRQTIQDAFINGEPVNLNNSDDSFNSDMSELRLSDLGGGLKQKKSRKGMKGRKVENLKKSRKSKKK